MAHKWFSSRAKERNSTYQLVVSRCLALDSFKSTRYIQIVLDNKSERILYLRKEDMKRPKGSRIKRSVIQQHHNSLSMHLILYFLLGSLIGVASQQNVSSTSSTEASVLIQTSTWPSEWSSTEPPVPDMSSNSTTPSPHQQSIKSLVMETAKPLESQHLSRVTSLDETQAINSSTANVIQTPTSMSLEREREHQYPDAISSFYLSSSRQTQISPPVNQPLNQQYRLEKLPPSSRKNNFQPPAELEELPLELLHEHEPMSSGDKLLNQLASLSLNQPRQTRSNVQHHFMNTASEITEIPVESSVAESQSFTGQLQSSLKPKHVEPPSPESTLDPAQVEPLDWSQMSQALFQADTTPEYSFDSNSGSPLMMQHVSAPYNYQQQLAHHIRQPSKSLRQLASKFLKSPAQVAQISNRPSGMISSASRLIPKSIKSLFEPLTAAGTRLAPLVSGGRRAKQLSMQESIPQASIQQAKSSNPQLPPLSLVLVNGQLYSVLNHNQPSSAASNSQHGNFDYQTSDTSEFPVFEAQSSNSHAGDSSTSNRGCNNPRHIIHADRTVVNHILESQQNFVIARVPIKKYPVASSTNSWPNSIEQQIQQQQQQQQLLSSQNHVYHAFPMQSLASSSPVVSAPTNIRYHPPAVSFEVQASSPRPSIWQSFANFFSSLTRRRPASSYLAESSNPSAVYSLDLPTSLYLGGGGRRWWHRRARRLDPLLMSAFRMLGSKPRYLETAQNRRTSSSNIDPMQRLLMLKTAYENEVCSPVSEVADKIKYSCLPNHCVASALASAAINLEQQQSIRHQHQVHQPNSLNVNDANSILDYYLTNPATSNSLTPPYVSAQSVLNNNYTSANLIDNSPLEVLQLDDSIATQLPIITYTHMNAYETPTSSRLAQPQHQHFTGGSQNLETIADLDEPVQPSLINKGGLAQRQSVHQLGRYTNFQAQLVGSRRQPSASKTFYQTVPNQVLDRPTISLGTIYQSTRRSPTSIRNTGYTTTQQPSFHLDWSNFATKSPKPTSTEAAPKKYVSSHTTENRSNRDPTELKIFQWSPNRSSQTNDLINTIDDDNPNQQNDDKDDNEDEAKLSNGNSRDSLQRQVNQTDSTLHPSNTLEESRARKTRRSRPHSPLPTYGLRTASLPPPEREFNGDTDEGGEQPGLRSGEEDDGSTNSTDCNCETKTTDSPFTITKVPVDAGDVQLDKWRRATPGALNHRNSQPINQSTSESLGELSLHQLAKERLQQVARFQNKSQYNLRNTTYRNLQLTGSLIPIQDQVAGPSYPTQTSTSTRAPWNSNYETSSIPSDISTTTAYSSSWNPGENLNLEQTNAQLNLSKFEPELELQQHNTTTTTTTTSTTPSIDEELQMIRELEEPEERLSRLGTGRPRIGGFNFRPLSVNEIIAEARRENQRSNVTGPNIGAQASASQVDKTSGGPVKEEDEADDGIVPHQYQIQIRTHLQPPIADEPGSKVSSSEPSQELSLDKMKERVKDRLFEHREEEHWHEKKWLKGRKRRKLVDGKWVLENLSAAPEDIENPIRLDEKKQQQEANTIQERHFAIPTPNFGHSAKFLDWVQRDVDMNEEPGEPTSHKQTSETRD